MVELWEIEWNSSMIEHGRDLGTMEFIFKKGGNLSDMNYVMFDVQDNSWEPLIKAVAERDHSHPDIIRKNVPMSTQQMQGQQQQQQPFFMDNSQQGALPFMGTGARSPREMNRLYNAAQRAADLQNYGQNPTAMNALRAGKYGTAAGKGLASAGRKIMEGARGANDYMRNTAGPKMKEMAGRGMEAAGRGMEAAKDMGGRAMAGAKDMGGRALEAFKQSGIGDRMKNFMSGAGRAISDLRHLPEAAKQSYNQMRAAGEDEARRSALEGGLGRGQRELDDAERRFVPGSQGFDRNMNQARGSTSQGLSRDFNVTPQLHTRGKNKGKPKESVEDAMRREIQEIGARRAEPKESFFAGMRRRGDERREAKAAEQRGDAFAPSNIVPEAPKLPDAPTPEAEAMANADATVTDTNDDMMNIDFVGPETGTPPDTGAIKPQMETATATETDPREAAFRDIFGRVNDEKGTGYAMNAPSGKSQLERGMASEVDLSNVDQKLTDQMIESLGIKNNQIGQAIMQRLRALPQYIKEQAAQGDAQAMDRVEDEAEAAVEEAGGNSDMNIDFGSNEMMTLSGDEHEASWNSLLKQMDIR